MPHRKRALVHKSETSRGGILQHAEPEAQQNALFYPRIHAPTGRHALSGEAARASPLLHRLAQRLEDRHRRRVANGSRPGRECRSMAFCSWIDVHRNHECINLHGSDGSRRATQPKAMGPAALLALMRPFIATGCSRKALFPEGIIARGIALLPGLFSECFDSSHAHSRGS